MQRSTKITLSIWLVAVLVGAASIAGLSGCAADEESANLNPQPLPPGPEQPKDEDRGQKGSQTGSENSDNSPPPPMAGGGTSGSSGAGASSSGFTEADAGGQ